MEAKDKAKELVEKFLPHAQTWDCYNDIPDHNEHEKQCAIICVDELIKENTEIETMVGQGFNLDYWESVRTEITKL